MITLTYSADLDKLPHYMAVHQSLQFANIIRQKPEKKYIFILKVLTFDP